MSYYQKINCYIYNSFYQKIIRTFFNEYVHVYERKKRKSPVNLLLTLKLKDKHRKGNLVVFYFLYIHELLTRNDKTFLNNEI